MEPESADKFFALILHRKYLDLFVAILLRRT